MRTGTSREASQPGGDQAARLASNKEALRRLREDTEDTEPAATMQAMDAASEAAAAEPRSLGETTPVFNLEDLSPTDQGGEQTPAEFEDTEPAATMQAMDAASEQASEIVSEDAVPVAELPVPKPEKTSRWGKITGWMRRKAE